MSAGGVGRRTGELAELQNALSKLSGAKGSTASGAESKRELFRRVLHYMTLGIDVSPLMGSMIMAGAVPDLVIKKMLYLYTSTYASSNPELALLAINMLQKDCCDHDPTLRGLALRALCTLNVPNLIEYVIGPLKNGLADKSAYVRRNAVIGTLKAYHIDTQAVIDAELLDVVRGKISNDSDAQVVANCLVVLLEIDGVESLLTKELVYDLLNKMRDFSEWSQCQVLDFVRHYTPEDQEEMFDIMNVLESRMQHSNSAVVLSAARIFLNITLNFPEVYQQVLERTKAPLLTLISTTSSSEASFAVLSHLHLLVQRAPILFVQDYKSFFCQYNDPPFVKRLKIEMLTMVVDPSNTYEIVTELTEYVSDVDIPIARESIRAIGRIAMNGDALAEIVDRLLQFLEMGIGYVTAETLVQVRNILRRFPERAGDCLVAIGGIEVGELTEESAREAFLWILGEYGHVMPDAPYTLEPITESFSEEPSPSVRLEMLTAALKIFLSRPAEGRPMLGAALEGAIADTNQDVHDRGLFYYRLLSTSAAETERIVAPDKVSIAAFAEDNNTFLTDAVFSEFNSLSVIYGQPEETFIEAVDEREQVGAASPAEERRSRSESTAFQDSSLLSEHEQETVVEDATIAREEIDAGTAPVGNLLGLEELMSLETPVAPLAAAAPILTLLDSPQLDPGTFQAKWGALPVGAAKDISIPPDVAMVMSSPEAIIRAMQNHKIMTMASGGSPAELKFFLFGQTSPTAHVMIELVLRAQMGSASMTIKADDSEIVTSVCSLVSDVLQVGS